MRHDRLQPRWCGGDLLVIVSADDDTSVQHVLRRLLADAAPFARWRWEQSGGWRGTDADGRPVTGRNLFGQVDGSGNDAVGSEQFARTVWAEAPDWFAGGTAVVMRRIAMDLDGWEGSTGTEPERVVSRDLTPGAADRVTRKPSPSTSGRTPRTAMIALGAHSRSRAPEPERSCTDLPRGRELRRRRGRQASGRADLPQSPG